MLDETIISKVISSLADKAIVTTATGINDRIADAKRNDDKDKIINELEEIISDLVSIKNDLLRALDIYEEEFVAQKIGKEDLAEVRNSIIPAIKTFVKDVSPIAGKDLNVEQIDGILDSFSPLLSYEVLNLLQSLGFNYKEAIGKPLTEKVSQFINKPSSETNDELRQSLELENVKMFSNFAALAMDKEAMDRFKSIKDL